MGTTAGIHDTTGDRLLSPEALAAYLDVPLKSVYRWRAIGTGPKGSRVGRHVRYRLSDVDAWLEAQSH